MDHEDDDSTKRKEAAELARQRVSEDWKWLMGAKQGRRIAHRLLSMSGVNRTTFTGNSETFHREGKRALGLEIQGEITRHAFAGYLEMVKEQGIPQ